MDTRFMTASEFRRKAAAEDEERARRDLRITSQIAAKHSLEAVVLRHAGFPDNGRLKEAGMLMDQAEAALEVATATVKQALAD